jgi:hypothetical protein
LPSSVAAIIGIPDRLVNHVIACARERQVDLLSTQGLREDEKVRRLEADKSGSRGLDIRDEQEGYGDEERKNERQQPFL